MNTTHVERPILFSAAMVRAILEGRKTQTRRTVKRQPQEPHYIQAMHGRTVDGEKFGDWQLWREVGPDYPDDGDDDIRCPYGQPGDRLWVRETWYTSECCDIRKPTQMEKPGMGYGWPVWYDADWSVNLRGRQSLEGGPGFTTRGKKRVAIHMPRWASRITLEITGIRVEQLKDISDDDCEAEGIRTSRGAGMIEGERVFHFPTGSGYSRIGRHAFQALWESVNGSGSWKANPWVWVIQFRLLSLGARPEGLSRVSRATPVSQLSTTFHQ